MKVERGILANIMLQNSIVGHLEVKIESSVVAVLDQDHWPKRPEPLHQKQNAKSFCFQVGEDPLQPQSATYGPQKLPNTTISLSSLRLQFPCLVIKYA